MGEHTGQYAGIDGCILTMSLSKDALAGQREIDVLPDDTLISGDIFRDTIRLECGVKGLDAGRISRQKIEKVAISQKAGAAYRPRKE